LRNGRIAGLRAEPSGLGRHRGEGGVHCTRRQEGSPKPEWERCHDHVYVTITNDTGAGSLRQVEAADNKSGALSFDSDGSGAGAAIQFANVGKGLDFSADDFFVV
jgi:hypothetical protein